MESTRKLQKKYGSRTMMLAIGIGFIFILIGEKPIGKGLVLGAIFSVINFVLIGETLPLQVLKKGGKVFWLLLGSWFLRYGIMAVPIILAIKLEMFNIFAAITGLFLIQIMILADQFTNIIFSVQKKEI